MQPLGFASFEKHRHASVKPEMLGPLEAHYADGAVETPHGPAPRVRTGLLAKDHMGTVLTRIGIGRMNYTVEPGLYAAGSPSADSPVLVSANYKLSFDTLRTELSGLDCWILVIDTKGINVWCAAGKGTFGTDQIVHQIGRAGLRDVVSHRRVIVPMLGAPGVAAHEVKEKTGFRVVYGPVRAADTKAFLEAGMRCTPEMRRVNFTLRDRLVLVPVEVMLSLGKASVMAAVLALLAALGPDGFSTSRLLHGGLLSAALFYAIYLFAVVLGPALLPWLPGRAFSLKGALLGAGFAAVLMALWHYDAPWLFHNGFDAAAWSAIALALTSFLLMNFTGASTFTSLSGVQHEMRRAVPAQIIGAVAGLGLYIGGLFA